MSASGCCRLRLRSGLGLALLLSATACATDYAPTPYWEIRAAAFNDLAPGKTTKEDVRRQIGVPLIESHFPRQDEDVWDYRYLEGSATRMLAYVYFDSNGRYKHMMQQPDPAFYAGGPR